LVARSKILKLPPLEAESRSLPSGVKAIELAPSKNRQFLYKTKKDFEILLDNASRKVCTTS